MCVRVCVCVCVCVCTFCMPVYMCGGWVGVGVCVWVGVCQCLVCLGMEGKDLFIWVISFNIWFFFFFLFYMIYHPVKAHNDKV